VTDTPQRNGLDFR